MKPHERIHQIMISERRHAEEQGLNVVDRGDPMTMDDLRSVAIVQYLTELHDAGTFAAQAPQLQAAAAVRSGVGAADDPVMRIPLVELEDELGCRTVGALVNARGVHLVFVGDLVHESERRLLKYRNLGRKGLQRVKEWLAAHGLELGMDVPGWQDIKTDALIEAEDRRKDEQEIAERRADARASGAWVRSAPSDRHERVEKFMAANGGVASVSELAELLELPESRVRRFARDRGVRRLGATFAFDESRAIMLADESHVDAPQEEDD